MEQLASLLPAVIISNLPWVAQKIKVLLARRFQTASLNLMESVPNASSNTTLAMEFVRRCRFNAEILIILKTFVKVAIVGISWILMEHVKEQIISVKQVIEKETAFLVLKIIV